MNLELWNEAETYEDIQLMPFVDYYSLISLKTIGICIFGVRFYIDEICIPLCMYECFGLVCRQRF